MTDWDADSSRLQANLQKLYLSVRDEARARAKPTVRAARAWHETMMHGLSPPDPAYIGAFRGEPGLENIGVQIGKHDGVPSIQVAAALDQFEERLQTVVERLDQLIQPDSDLNADRVMRLGPFGMGTNSSVCQW